MMPGPLNQAGLQLADGLMGLAAEWAEAAGSSLLWAADADITARMLSEPDPAKRALWRCVLQLLERVSAASGFDVRQLAEDFELQPVQQGPEGP